MDNSVSSAPRSVDSSESLHHSRIHTLTHSTYMHNTTTPYDVELDNQPTTVTASVAEEMQQEVNQLERQVAQARRLGFKGLLKAYTNKFRGKEKPPPRMAYIEAVYSWIAAFVGIGLISALHYHVLDKDDLALVVGSFGASAVLIFGATKSPLSQPRNVIGGHFVSAVIGVSISWIVHKDSVAIACALAVATSISAMIITNTVHPPGGATALIAVMLSKRMAWGGYLFVFMPILSGAGILLAVAL